MDIISLLLLAVGLSMDAFVVSVCKGLALKKVSLRHMCIVGAWFGGFQALMPSLGYLLGSRFEQYITAIDHWIAFVLLVLIGANMIREALSKEEAEEANASLAFKTMLLMAVATSIDALAVGGIARRRRAACGKTAISEFQGGLKVAVVAPAGACPLNFDGRSARRGKLGVDL